MNFILLAGGNGQRMGGNKALMEYHGQPWILSQLRQIREVAFQNITVVTNPEAEASLVEILAKTNPSVSIVTNSHTEMGPFSSLLLAIAATPEAASFVCPVDTPLRAATLKKLRQAWLQHGHLDALVPSYKDRKGHPVILSTELQRELLKFNVGNPEARLDFVIKALPENKKKVFKLEDPFISLNLNTPEDLAALPL